MQTDNKQQDNITIENKKKNKKRVNIKQILAVVVIVISVGSAIFGISNIFRSETKQEIEITMLSACVTDEEWDDEKGLYIVADKDYNFHVVCMTEDTFTSYAEVYEYTFQEGTFEEDGPTTILTGYRKAMGEDEILYSMGYANDVLFTSDVLDFQNFTEYFGAYYVDTTYQPGDGIARNLILCVSSLVLAVAGGWMLYESKGRQN